MGLIAINVLGDYNQLPNELPNSSASMPQPIFQSQDTMLSDGLNQMNVDNKTAQELNRLNELKRNAVDNED